jgi:hypothetical protein
VTKDEIDTMWQQAMRQSIEDGEMFTRYHFAKLVAAKEREACAKVCEQSAQNYYPVIPEASGACTHLAAAIRARGQA